MSTGRVALVTGAGANVGRTIAHRLMSDGVASKMIVNDIDPGRAKEVTEELMALGHDAVAAALDVSDWDATRELFDNVGGVDILVNNAGLPLKLGTYKRFVDSDPDEWKPWLDVSLYGVMNMTRWALPHMIASGWGRIVTITSDAGRTGEPRLGAYGAAKAGAAALMRTVAKEVGGRGITANNVALGAMSHTASQLTEEQIKAMLSRYIVPRFGEGDDAAAVVAFLAGTDSSWISGQTIPVNGGYTVAL
jgi:2-hydroxycyclohexanecarboxyl-CoA dehydrogenase